MTRLPVPGGDDGTWGDLLNQYLLRQHKADGTHDISLNDLRDVTAGSAAPGQVLKYNGNKWAPSADNAGATAAPNATVSSLGVVQLAGDLGGTATSPTVPGLSSLDNAKIDKAEKGQPGGVAQLDGSGKVIPGQLVTSNITKVLPYSYTGVLNVNVGTFRLYNDMGSSWTITSIRASVGTAPAGSSVVVDVNKNGSSVFTNQANRPTIAPGTNTSGKVTNMDVTTVADGEYLTVDLDQVGSTTAGADLTVQLEVV